MSIYETSITNPKKQLEFYKDLSKELQKENEELKKQLEDYKKWYQDELEENAELSDLWINRRARTIELENQQKMFIEWLEKEIENCKYGEENYADGDDMTYHNENELRKEILSKYKEIIGDKE